MSRYIPAIAAGVAVVAVVSAVMLSGVLSPGSLMSQTRVAGYAEPKVAAENALEDNAAKDAGENEAGSVPDTSESLFMAEEAPAESAAPEMAGAASDAAGADQISIPLYVTQKTFDALKNLLMDEGAEFCLDEDLMILYVTEENRNYFAQFAQDYALGISPLPGETYEIRVSG